MAKMVGVTKEPIRKDSAADDLGGVGQDQS
jgi:hypothetical protein